MVTSAIPSSDDSPGGQSVPVSERRLGWPLYLMLAVLFAAYLGLNKLIGERFEATTAAWKPFASAFSTILVVLVLTPIVVRIERRFRLDSRPRGRVIAVHGLSMFAFSAVHTAGMVALRKAVYALIGASYTFGNVFLGSFYELQRDAVVYLLILLAAFAAREFRARRAGELHAAKLVADLSEARLQHLTTQIEPHFLFNSLHAISNRMREDIEAADQMISQLGYLLRAAYETDQPLMVPLGKELEWLRRCAAMMAERFCGQLTFQLTVQSALEAVLVPRLLLQPIVENAFQHGLRAGRGWLSVTVGRMNEWMYYTVSDDGVGFAGASSVRAAELSNVKRRLELLFRDGYHLDLAARTPTGTVVTVLFPVSAGVTELGFVAARSKQEGASSQKAEYGDHRQRGSESP